MKFLAARDAEPAAGGAALFGAPFDATVSYRGGARLGPARIREASYSLEEYSLRLDASLEDVPFIDVGDLDLPHGSPARALDLVAQTASDLARRGAVPFMLGGEHLLTLGAVQGLAQVYPDLAVIQFDAHADLRDQWQGEALSHATVMRRVTEVVGPERLFPLGIRSGSAEEVAWGRARVGWPQDGLDLVEQTRAAAAAAGRRPVYVTIDIDVLDPAAAPGTGTPEPGGVSFQNLLAALDELRRLRIVGCDLVEVAPPLDPSGRTEIVAAAVCRHVLIGWFGRPGGVAPGPGA